MLAGGLSQGGWGLEANEPGQPDQDRNGGCTGRISCRPWGQQQQRTFTWNCRVQENRSSQDDWGPRVAASVREADGELGKQIFTGTQSGDSQREPGSEEGTTKTPRWIRDAPA